MGPSRKPVHNIADKKLSQNCGAKFSEGVDENTPFCIGESGEGNCIRVDPGQKVATLMGIPRGVKPPELSKYHGCDSHDITPRQNIESLFSDITILRISGSVTAVLPSRIKTSWMNDPSPIPPDSSEVRIRGEELKSRIMGFGSGG
jgi:hypothetical protein